MASDRVTVENVDIAGDATTTLRSRTEIEKRFAELEKEIASEAEWSAEGGDTAASYKDRLAGHLAAFRWILYGGPAPFTEKTFDLRALWREGQPPSELAL